MKLPRDVSGQDLVQALRKLGYQTTRQKGSHIRVTTEQMGQHHEVIPSHHPIKPGTLNGILKSVASQHKMTVDELITTLKLRDIVIRKGQLRHPRSSWNPLASIRKQYQILAA